MFDPDRLLENSVDRPSTSGVLELARKAQDGDPTALGQLFQHFEEPLRRMVRIRLGAQLRAGGGIESLDVVQLTFVKAWSKLDGFEIRSEREVLAWLARIAERQIYDELDKMNAAKRGYGRNVSIEELLDASIRIDPPATDTLPDGHAERAEVRRIFDECVEELDEPQREVILLHAYADMEWADIAREIGAPNAKAAEARCYRAKLRLGELLSRRLPQNPLG